MLLKLYLYTVFKTNHNTKEWQVDLVINILRIEKSVGRDGKKSKLTRADMMYPVMLFINRQRPLIDNEYCL